MEENPVGSLNDVVCNTLQRRRIQSEETQINREFDAGVSTLDRSEGQIRIWLCVEAVNHWLLAQSFSLALCTCIIDTTKLYAGRLRPDFLARLEREGYTSSSVGVDWCDVAREGRLSFPSGHSGLSFAAFVPLIMYFMGVLKAFRGGSLWRTVVSFIPLILPITVAVSRTRDNRHNFSDIVAGSIIGACCALLSVGLLFRVDEQTGTLVPRQMEFVSKRDIRSAPNENP
ncbi:phosphatidic acid phosphatase [Trypanosoma grayi]|uniref:phosphatidic acid phosphatase n=1 Tax=Trypanosoma grayi TaxID=71804 RepID=UPI0004F49322|nr:phosphatidic acid phosphatase [Trypanosoma grayi]KEG15093.1 phosphatidic acid phosphatase [Trypanosoma grayi]